jgi:hypothetical protein
MMAVEITPESPKKNSVAAALLKVMRRHKRQPSQVLGVGSRDGGLSMSWADFVKGPGLAKNPESPTTYSRYSVWAGPRRIVARDLVVVGDGWWIQRVPSSPAKYMYVEPPSYDANGKPFEFCTGHKVGLAAQQLEPRRKKADKSNRPRRRRTAQDRAAAVRERAAQTRAQSLQTLRRIIGQSHPPLYLK